MSGLFSLLVEPLGGQTDSRALKPPLLGILNHKLFEDNPDICGLYRSSEKKKLGCPTRAGAYHRYLEIFRGAVLVFEYRNFQQ
jgi:hypothetical protein